jgi:hypothetical protein
MRGKRLEPTNNQSKAVERKERIQEYLWNPLKFHNKPP